jgi:hypothetical protein
MLKLHLCLLYDMSEERAAEEAITWNQIQSLWRLRQHKLIIPPTVRTQKTKTIKTPTTKASEFTIVYA